MKNFKKNKKGFLLGEETLKIIIAVICIVFLIYLLVAIYNSSTGEKKIAQAKEIFSRTEAIASSLKEGESERQDVPNPEGWHLYSFIEYEKPNACAGEGCLCICEKALITPLNSQAAKCDKKGACLIIKNLASSGTDIKIRGPDNLLFIQIKNQNNRIFIGRSE